jgi:hypothetical protein
MVVSVWVAAGLAGCSGGSSGGLGTTGETAVTVARSAVPLTTSGDRFVTRQAGYSASVGSVDGAFAVRTPGAALTAAPQFATFSIERGANRLDFGAAGAVADGLGGVGVGRGNVLEQIQAVTQGLELSWTFPRAPDGSGDTLVRVRVTGLELVSATPDSTVLRDTASGDQLRVGRALWVDEAGKKTALSQSFADGVLTFRVPEALLLSSAFPAVLDPLVTPASLGAVEFAAGVAAGDINLLTVGVSGPGNVTSTDAGIDCGTTGTSCSASYTKDSLVTLTPASTDPGGYFVGWSGLCNGTGRCTIAMSKVRFVYAYFEPGFWPVKVFRQGKGKGTISWNGNTCLASASTCTFQVPNTRPVRQTVNLAASPDANSSFTGWSADCGPDSCSLYVDRPKNAYATFASTVARVRVEVDELGEVTGPNGLSCRPGAPCDFTVSITAPAQTLLLSTNPSDTFYSWGGDCRGSATTCTITLDGDKNVYASWRGIHTATMTTAEEVVVFAQGNADHAGGGTQALACTACHVSNLMAAHARRCEVCHAIGGPAEKLIGNWNGSCTVCHASFHTATGADHFGVYYNSSASCDRCHTSIYAARDNATNCFTCHDKSTIAAAAGDITPPVTTSDAQPVYVGGGTINLSATDVGSGVSLTYYFNLNHSRWEIGNQAGLGTVPTSGPGITRTLEFYSIDHAGNKEAPKSVTFLVKPLAVAAPSAPTGISALAGSAQATLSWTTGTGSTSSVVQYGTAPGVYTATIDPATSPQTITGLTNGATIYYQVGAKNVTGTTWSAQYTVTPTLSLPSAPTAISAVAGNAQVTISWTAGTGSTSSVVQYGTTSGVYTTTIDPATSPRTITGLTSGTTIYYRVGARNVTGLTWSGPSTVTPVPSVPSAPTAISAAAGNAQATITWTAGTGSTSSLVRYGSTSGVYATTIDPATSPWTITGLTNGTAVYYQVGAKNAAGTTWAPESSATPAAASHGSWTTAGVFTIPAGVTSLTIEAVGGGGEAGIEIGSGTGLTGGTATVTYGSLSITANGGIGGGNAASSSKVGLGGAGGTALCSGSLCSSLALTPGAPGEDGGWYAPPDDTWGRGGLGGAPNGASAIDPPDEFVGGAGGGGGGGSVNGIIPVTPGGTVTIAIGSGSSVKVSW